MDFVTILPILIAFAISVILCPVLIPILRKFKFGQQVREEGNPDHLKKQGTPTMGGIAFIVSIIVTSLIFMFTAPEILPVLLLTVGFALVGFLDDFLKIKKKQSEGLKAWQKLLLQFVMTGIFAVFCYLSPAIGSEVIIPFSGGKTMDMGWFYIPFVFLVVLGTDNGVNFTDGLDGLCSSVTSVVALFFFIASIVLGTKISPICGAVAGALFGYLLFNAYPAKVFMGDTGSLALGGFVSAIAIVLKLEWFVLIIGLIYFVEVLSVILQVGYFKMTHGKRLFKMAPIHHHFELSGYSETQIVTLFTVITILLCGIGLVALP